VLQLGSSRDEDQKKSGEIFLEDFNDSDFIIEREGSSIHKSSTSYEETRKSSKVEVPVSQGELFHGSCPLN